MDPLAPACWDEAPHIVGLHRKFTKAAVDQNAQANRRRTAEIRHRIKRRANRAPCVEHVVNAGDGALAHPTQALLDVHTLREEFESLEGRTVAIVGDVLHSRVAHSTIRGLHRLGANVVLVGPEVFLPSDYKAKDVSVERDLDGILPHVDAVILLRIQRERFAAMPLTDADYIAGYQLNDKRLAKLRPEAIIMHPGPYNRGMELDECVLEFAGWRYAKQVMHGVYVRMAVLDLLVNGIKHATPA